MVPVAVKHSVCILECAVGLLDIVVDRESHQRAGTLEADPVACAALHVGGVVCADAEEIAVIVGGTHPQLDGEVLVAHLYGVIYGLGEVIAAVKRDGTALHAVDRYGMAVYGSGFAIAHVGGSLADVVHGEVSHIVGTRSLVVLLDLACTHHAAIDRQFVEHAGEVVVEVKVDVADDKCLAVAVDCTGLVVRAVFELTVDIHEEFLGHDVAGKHHVMPLAVKYGRAFGPLHFALDYVIVYGKAECAALVFEAYPVAAVGRCDGSLVEYVGGVILRVHPELDGERFVAKLYQVVGFLHVIVGAVEAESIALLAFHSLAVASGRGCFLVGDEVGGGLAYGLEGIVADKLYRGVDADIDGAFDGGVVVLFGTCGGDGEFIFAGLFYRARDCACESGGVEVITHTVGQTLDLYACGAKHLERDVLYRVAGIDELAEVAGGDGDGSLGVERLLEVIAEVGRLVVAYVLPCDSHAILTFLHQSGHLVFGGNGGGEDEQVGVGAAVMEYYFLAPVTEEVGLEVGSAFGTVRTPGIAVIGEVDQCAR